jgi:hypothetical protein
MEGGLMKFFGKGTTNRLVEEPEEKRDKLVKVLSYRYLKNVILKSQRRLRSDFKKDFLI